MKDLQKPCSDCAFVRTSTPGNLGGSAPEVYVGQSIGPFFIPCHLTYELGDEKLIGKLNCTGGCAGSAIYRANLGVDHMMPEGINKLPADRDLVFSTHAEFVAHHRQITVEEAFDLLGSRPPLQLLKDELNKAHLLNKDRTLKE